MLTAVIGHGRSPEGKGWGRWIDNADRVIRLWNWQWQDPADYGSRYDWGLLEIHSCIGEWKQHNQRQPSQGWVASLLQMGSDLLAIVPPDAVIVDQQESFLRHIPQAMRGKGETGRWHLTRGGVAACWAISTSRSGDSIVLVGFDNVNGGYALPAEAAFAPVYQDSPGFWGLNGYKAGATKEGNHDYPAERRLIEYLAERRGVSLAFTQDIWPEMPVSKPPRGPSAMPLFRYNGEYPEGKTSINAYGCVFGPGAEIEIADQFVEKARGNRFFEEIVDGKAPAHMLTREQLIVLAERRGAKIDKRWNAEKIAQAVAALDPEGE